MRTTTRNKLNFLFLIDVVFITLQVHGRCKKNNISGSKHYLTVASGVMMSVFVSPVIAAVTVGKGFNIKLQFCQIFPCLR